MQGIIITFYFLFFIKTLFIYICIRSNLGLKYLATKSRFHIIYRSAIVIQLVQHRMSAIAWLDSVLANRLILGCNVHNAGKTIF